MVNLSTENVEVGRKLKTRTACSKQVFFPKLEPPESNGILACANKIKKQRLLCMHFISMISHE
jgi:hypothetical protein